MSAPKKPENLWVIATGNAGKLHEFRGIFESVAEIRGLGDFKTFEPAIEDADTFLGNAKKKAEVAIKALGRPCLADDSGLVVPALGGAPGIHSARYAGEAATSEDNINKLLSEMAAFEGDDRRAYFFCALCLLYPDGHMVSSEGRVDGVIRKARSGDGGFGYDPVFEPLDFDGATMAEISREEKASISHRGRAARTLLTKLR